MLKNNGWFIRHPGSGETLQCESFEEAYDKWFEGFNIPVLVNNGVQEPFETSYKRVKEHIAKR